MTEPSLIIRWVTYFFAGGDSAIWGAVGLAIISAVGLHPNRTRRRRPFFVILGFAVCITFIFLGSPPVPVWFEILTAVWVVLAFWKLLRGAPVNFESIKENRKPKFRNFMFFSSFVWLITALVVELPWHHWSSPPVSVTQLLVIGDSITAGLNDRDDTWPRQLSRTSNLNVVDASQPGATLHSAREQNRLLGERSGHLILEIGGNDMLEGLPIARFEEELDQLLTEVVVQDRIVVMFELPLPPLHAAYGAVQRRQARSHRVRLIPKRDLAGVLTTSGSTVDGIHLTNEGQSRLMELVKSLFADRIQPGEGTYERLERRN